MKRIFKIVIITFIISCTHSAPFVQSSLDFNDEKPNIVFVKGETLKDSADLLEKSMRNLLISRTDENECFANSCLMEFEIDHKIFKQETVYYKQSTMQLVNKSTKKVTHSSKFIAKLEQKPDSKTKIMIVGLPIIDGKVSCPEKDVGFKFKCKTPEISSNFIGDSGAPNYQKWKLDFTGKIEAILLAMLEAEMKKDKVNRTAYNIYLNDSISKSDKAAETNSKSDIESTKKGSDDEFDI